MTLLCNFKITQVHAKHGNWRDVVTYDVVTRDIMPDTLTYINDVMLKPGAQVVGAGVFADGLQQAHVTDADRRLERMRATTTTTAAAQAAATARHHVRLLASRRRCHVLLTQHVSLSRVHALRVISTC